MVGSPNSCPVRYRPLDPDTLRDPFPTYRSLLAEQTAIWDDDLFAWVVSGSVDCRRVLEDAENFARDRRRLGRPVPAAGLSIQSLDPPDHLALRMALLRAFKRLDVAAIAAAVCDELLIAIDVAPVQRTLDYMRRFAAPAAMGFASRLVGLPDIPADNYLPLFRDLSRSMDNALDAGRTAHGTQATLALTTAIEAAQRASAQSGLIALLSADPDVQQMPAAYVRNTIAATFNASFSTAYCSMGVFLKLVLDQPALGGQIRAAPEVGRCVEELLRFTSPAQSTRRYATRDVLIGEASVRANDPILTLMAAANRDPEVFDNADAICLDRARNPHLAFGAGSHVCVGRYPALTFLSAYAIQLVHIERRLCSAGAPRWLDTFTLRCMSRLPVRRLSDRLT